LLRNTFVPGVRGGVTGPAVLLLVAIVGTTVAPWQLFFQQSNVIDKRITPRWIRYERADTIMGAFVTNIAAGAYMMFTAFAVANTAYNGKYTDALGVAQALSHTIGYVAGALAAIILVDASIIGACTVTLASSYAFGDIFGLKHSLHQKASDAKGFYSAYALQVAVAAAIVLIPGAPLGVITEYVQVLAGALLPSATLFLLLLCNDKEVLGPWVNRTWLNVVTTFIIGVLIVLSAVLTINVLLPSLNVPTVTVVLFAIMGVALLLAAVAGIAVRQRQVTADRLADVRRLDRNTWRMSPMALLSPAPKTRLHTILLVTLRTYLIVAVILIAGKLVSTFFH
jgi:Mn2+/Fe2+ NRAMP family transporter